MRVAVDLGNSAVKFGVFEDGVLTAVERVECGRSFVEDVIPPPHLFLADTVVVLASAPLRMAEFLDWCPVRCRVLGDEIRAIIDTTYEEPRDLGLDRVAAAVGARARHPGRDVVIVDVGTAITVDLVRARGDLLAIAIAPGPQAAADGLRARAPHLPRADLAAGDVTLPARGTDDSMRAGHVLGAAGQVDRLAHAAAEQLLPSERSSALFLLCGGAATALLPHLRTAFAMEGDLVLFGINTLAAQISPAEAGDIGGVL